MPAPKPAVKPPRKPPSVFFAAMLRGKAADRVEQALVDAGLRQQLGSGHWPRGNRHQSLSDLLPHPLDLKKLIAVGAAVRCAPVTLRFDRIESKASPSGVHWTLRCSRSDDLRRLLDAIRLALVQQGFDKGLNTTPHVTLSYRAPQALEQPVKLAPIDWRIEQFQLVRSTGHGATYHYEELGRWPLEGEPAPQADQLSLI